MGTKNLCGRWPGLTVMVGGLALLLAGCLQNVPPEANAGLDQTVQVNTEVKLDGSQSWDMNGDALEYEWSIASMPEGSSVAISEPTLVNPTFVPDMAGIYRIFLIVSDGTMNSQRAETVVTAVVDTGGGFDHRTAVGTCVSCHDGVTATGKTTNHLASSDTCDACHATAAWAPVMSVDHTQVVGEACAGCHDNAIARGKPAVHVQTTADCGECHRTDMWVPVLDGSTPGDPTTTKPASHIATTEICEACHSPGNWVPAMVDHTQVVGSCASCHDGVIASGKSTNHPQTTANCDACHATGSWAPVAMLDHTEVIGTCETCHAPPPDHVAVNVSANCDVCHAVDTWPSASRPLPTVTTTAVQRVYRM